MGTRLIRSLLGFVLLLTWGAGCGDSGPDPLGIQVSIFSPIGHDPWAGVSIVRLQVEEAGNVVSSSSTGVYDPLGGLLALDGIPYGPNRQVVVEGWSAGPTGELAALLSRGKSLKTNVVENDGGHTVQVMLAPVNTLVPLTNALTKGLSQLSQGRVGHTVTSTDRGEIVIAGGGTFTDPNAVWWRSDAYENYLQSVELIRQRDNSSQLLPSSMFFGRVWHSGTALGTGQVLLAGGLSNQNVGGALDRVEVYNPGDVPTIQVLEHTLSVPRWGHSTNLVDPDNYTVLFVGGDEDGTGTATYEIWSPYVGTISVGELPDQTQRRHHQATLFEIANRGLAVLITGGENTQGVLDSVLIYDVVTGNMFVSPGKLSSPRTQHSATWLAERNYIYVVGGFTNLDRTTASASIDVYDIPLDSISSKPGFNLFNARGGHTAVAGDGNSVFFVGGLGNGGVVLNSIEVIYEYLDPAVNQFRIEVAQSAPGGIPSLPEARFGQKSVYTDGGMMMLVGGMTDGGLLPKDLVCFNPL